MTARTSRATIFTLAGTSFLVCWVLTDPDYDTIHTEWSYVLGFSATLLTLAVALPVFGRLMGGRSVVRLSFVAGGAVALCSLVNVVEDGLGMGEAFWVFIASLAVVDVALLAMTVAIAVTRRGGRRVLALVPAGTLAAILFFVPAGGVLMMTTWLAAAALALVLPSWAAVPAGVNA